MKRKILLMPIIGLFLYAVLAGNSTGPGGASSLDCTGASGGPAGCGGATCHGSASSSSVGLSVQLLSGTTPVTQYVGGSSYTIRISAANTIALSLPRFGFQVGVVKASTTTNAGSLSAIAGTHLVSVSGIDLVEHNPLPLPPTTGTGGGGSTYVVDIPWVAPVAGTGTVSVDVAVNTVNNNTLADAGDKWKTLTQNFPEVAASLGPVTGTATVCVGATTALSNTMPGGTWSSSMTIVATVGATTGIVTGLLTGTTTITYDAGSAGYATKVVTVHPTPASITGTTSGCEGSTFTLATMSSGGGWSSSNTAVATVGASTGIVSGVAGGTATISYSYTTGCSTIRYVTINPLAPAGTVSGSPTVCVTATTSLASTVAGGSWSSSDISKATVGATTGLVTGIAVGAVVITYTNANACGSGTATKALTVQPLSACATGAGSTSSGITKGLLVYPDPSRGSFMVYVPSTANDEATMEVLNMLGVVVLRQPIATNTTTNVHINTPGIYTLRTHMTDGTYVQKIIVE